MYNVAGFFNVVSKFRSQLLGKWQRGIVFGRDVERDVGVCHRHGHSEERYIPDANTAWDNTSNGQRCLPDI